MPAAMGFSVHGQGLGSRLSPPPQALASCQSFMLAALVSRGIGLASYAVMDAGGQDVGASVIDDALDARAW